MERSLESTLHLPETKALALQADLGNAKVLWRLVIACALVSLGAGLIFFALGQSLPMAVALANAAALAVLYLRSDAPLLTERVRLCCFVVILGELALFTFGPWGLSAEPRLAVTAIVFPLLTLFFHFRVREHLGLLVAMGSVTAWIWTRELAGLWLAPRQLGGVLWPALATLAVALCAWTLDERRRRAFLSEWRREVSLDRERTRMKEEIEDARQIQLSMLPRTTPQLSWLEVSAISLPASEVGGDYYDYFLLPDEALAVVVGDVAGHGVASGLLLAALRSCLYLLRQDLATPIGVLHKLDEMVRHTTDRRLLATLQCAHFDASSRQVTIANAGHPAALLYRAAGRDLSELALPGLPLGTRLPARFGEVSARLERGDIVFLYSDGLLEMGGANGELYGEGRLQRAILDAVSRQRPLREVRGAVMADLANFKGDSRRGDDVTLVVVRVK